MLAKPMGLVRGSAAAAVQSADSLGCPCDLGMTKMGPEYDVVGMAERPEWLSGGCPTGELCQSPHQQEERTMQAQLAHQMALAPVGNIVIGGMAASAIVGCLVLFFGALLSIVRSDLTGGMKLVWIVFALAAPFLGCLLWFLVGRRDSQRRAGIA